MLTGVILKVCADLGFYLSVAGTLGAAFGAQSAQLFIGWFALTAAGLLSWLLRSRGVLRFLPLAAAAAALFCFADFSTAETVVLLPELAYVVYLAAVRRFEADQEIERQAFSVLWKLLIAETLICLIARVPQYVTHVGLPIGLITMLCQILLIRSLRHEEEVRSRPRYQLTELLLAVSVAAVILLLGSETGVHLIGAGLKGLYFAFLFPLLSLLVRAAVFVFTGVAWAVSALWALLQKLFSQERAEVVIETPPYWESSRKLYLGEAESAATPRKVIVALIILCAVVLLFFIFRWLSRRARRTHEDTPVTDERSAENAPEAAVSARDRSAVAHVRAAYRRYLRLGTSQGIRHRRTDTTLDIRNRFSGLFPNEEADALRELYLRARYDGRADREDAARAKELLAQLKKSGQD